METQRICPSCHKPLAADVPLGLCPECLLKAGLGTGAPSRKPGGESGFVPPAVEELQELFPQLEILELIGKGGMGAVYKARQRTLDRLVALKILPPGAAEDPGFAERFNREARALARLCHPHIVAVHDFGQVAGQPYLVMEYVDGLNLRQAERAGRLTPEQALAIIPQICEALQFAHNEGVVHRDIKPENILLDRKGRVKITDFGIAKILGAPAGTAALTGAKDVLGTPHYMAPEQLEKPTTVDHRADIYSLGVVFYEMLTGELPLGKFQPPSKKVQVDARLDEVVLHALEKEPERRYQHASEVKSDVETIATTPSSSSSGRQSAPSEDQSRLTSAATTSFRRLQEKAAFFFIAAACFLVATVWFASKHEVIPALLSGVGLIGFGIAGFRHARAAQQWQATIRASQPGAAGAGSRADEAALAKAREEVKNPASWLVATGILNWVAIPFFVLVIAARLGQRGTMATPMLFALLAALFLSSAIILAGLKMKRLEAYGLAILGSILAIFITPGNIIGLPVGIWCLVTLFRRDVREAFGKARLLLAESARPKAGRVGWLAAAGVCGLALLVWGATSARILQHGLRSARLAAVPPTDARSPYPKAAHISTNNLSVLIYHDDVDLHYALFHADKFSTRIANTSMGGAAWLDQGGVTLVNQRTFGFRRESWDPERLNVNGREFDLRAGRVLVLRNDGAVEQLALFPSLAVARNPEQLAKLIHEQHPSPVTTIVTTVNGSAGSGTTFGPVIERVVNDDGVKRDFFIDLDTGKLLSPPQGLNFSDTNAFVTWLRTNGIDAMGETSVSVRGLVGMEMIVRPLAGPQWESLKPQDALADEVLQQGAPGSPVFLSAKGELPETFLFKTRECGVGLLQITGFTENPRGVKIRYKLVRPLVPRADLDQDIPLARALEESKAIFPDGPPLTEEEVVAAVRAIKINHPDIPEAAYQIYQRVVNERVLPKGMYFDRVRGWNPGTAHFDVDWRDLTLDFDRAGIKGHPPGMIFNYRVRARFLGSGPGGRSERRPIQTNSAVFGPVIERVIEQRPAGTNLFLDLDTGRLLTVPAGIAEILGNNNEHWQGVGIPSESRPFQYIAWLRQSGADLMAHGGKEVLGFDGYFCFAHGSDANDWDSWEGITPEQVVYVGDYLAWARRSRANPKLEEKPPKHVPGAPHTMREPGYRQSTDSGSPVVNVLTREKSVTYYFRTREGASGLLQIAGFTENPQGVKIRYKLVETPGSPATREMGERQRLARRAAASASDQSALHWAELSRVVERLIAGQPARTGYDIEIWEKVPGVAGEYRIRADVQQFELKPPTPEISLPRGKVYFLPASNRFYVQWDSPLASTLHYYGPFEGDPVQVLGLATPDSAR